MFPPPYNNRLPHSNYPVQPAASASSSSVTNQRRPSGSFTSLIRLGHLTASEMEWHPDMTAQEIAYENYAYFPHSIGEVEHSKLSSRAQPHAQYIAGLCALEAEFAQNVRMSMQPSSANAHERRLVPSEAARINGQQAIKNLPCHFRRAGSNAHSRLSGQDGIQSKLSIRIAPRARDLTICLSRAFAEMCQNRNLHGFASAKTFAPVDQPIRSETGILYLSDSDPAQAAALARTLDQYFIHAVATKLGIPSQEVDLGQVYGNVASADNFPGGQWVRPGISYSETSRRGETRSEATGRAVTDMHNGYAFEESLRVRLDQAGYESDNPAFAKRSDRDAPTLSIEDRISRLQNGAIPTRAHQNERARFLLQGSQ
jgi:hypothetical protein